MMAEIDFVFAGVLTAVCGKYYSMWRVAKTVDVGVVDGDDTSNKRNNKGGTESDVSTLSSKDNWKDKVPTNAFQPTLLDGHTTPTVSSRFLAFLLPMPQLFRAGVIASTIGYGLTSLLIRLRTMLIPEYVVPTVPVSVPLAAIYTGVFMAIVSNVRYQLLQGIIEPYFIDGVFRKIEMLGDKLEGRRGVIGIVGRTARLGCWKQMKGLMIVLVRWANGLLGSWIAIGGMRACGLQKLKD